MPDLPGTAQTLFEKYGSAQARPLMRRLLPVLVGLLGALVLGAVALLWQQYRSTMEQRIGFRNAEALADYQATVEHQAAGLGLALQAMVADPRLADDLASGDIDRLQRHWRPTFERLRHSYGISHFYFLDDTRHTLLRLHNVDKRGDLIDRHTARQAEFTGQLAWGLELGPLGTFTLRAVQPVQAAGRRVGYVELGMEIEDILDQLRHRSGAHLALAIDKGRLQRTPWEAGMRMLGRPAEWDRLRHSVIVHATQGRLPDALAALADHAPGSDHGHARPAPEVHDDDGVVWRIAASRVRDVAGQEVGDLLVITDISADRAAFRRMMWLGGGVGGGLLALLLGFVVVVLRHYDAVLRGQQDALRSSEQRLSFALLGANDGLWDWNLESDEVYYSPRWLGMLGYQPGELPNSLDTWARLVHPDDKAATLQHVEDYLAGRTERYDVEFRMRHKDGHWLDILARAQLARDAAGQPLVPRRLVGTHVDISERRRAQERIEASEAALRAERDLFVGGPVGVLIWRNEADWPLDYASANIGNVFGYNAGQMLAPGFHYAHCVHPDDLARVAEEVAGHLADVTRKTWEQHYRIVWPDGSVHWLYDFTVAERDAEGRALRLRGYVTDETEARETAKRLAEVREQLEFAIQGSGVGLWDWRVPTGELVLNARWAELLGYTLEELAPIRIDTWQSVAHPDDLPRSEAALQAHFSGASDRYVCEVRMRHKSGAWIWVLDQGRVVEWQGDDPAHRQPLRMVGTHTDITRLKALEESLQQERGLLKSLIQNIPDLVWMKAPDGTFLACNPRFERFIGQGEADLLGKTHQAVRQSEWAGRIEDQDQAVMAGRATQTKETWVTFADDGHQELLEITQAPMLDERGAVVGLLGIGHDITRRKQAEDNLRLAASVFSHAREGIMITTPDGEILDVNQAFTEITGYAREEVLGGNPRLLASGRHGQAFFQAMWHDLREQGHWHGELWNRRKNGDLYPELLTIGAVRDETGAILRYVALFSDITRLKEQQRQLEHIAHFDALTGLPNRVLLADRLHQAMAQAVRRATMLAVVYLDLDGFKAVNDSHGHDVGDRLLTTVATRMKHALRESDTLARLGGDEFVAVLLDLEAAAGCVPLLERLLEAAAEPVRFDGLDLRVSASLGVAFYPQADDIDADQLLRQADQAMYQAKLAGKNRYHLFDADQDRHVRGHHESLERIRRALAEREFELHYQPKVNLRTSAVVGAEALIRWRHPERGLLAPAVFLPVIEDHPLSIEIGEWVLDTALAQIEAWKQAGLNLPVSVNINALQLQQPGFVEALRALLAAHPGVAAGDLELEVLETSALEDITRVSDIILACRSLGVGFALDDFGTGYSSLTYLKRLPAGQLKIDQSFVRDMLDDPEDLAILEGVLGLAHAFRRGAIAEGVETAAHGEMLLRLGCELAQGYAIARPMPAEAMPGWLASWRPDPKFRQLPVAGRDDLPILFGMVEHRAWIAAMASFLTGARDRPPSLESERCRFGEWLMREAQARHADDPAFARVQVLHREIHARAEALVECRHQDGTEAAAGRIGELHALRDLLLEDLMRLIK